LEYSVAFLDLVSSYLNPDGIILAVYSSFTKPERIFEHAEKMLYTLEKLDSMHVFFEDILVVKISRLEIRKELEKEFTSLAYFSKGKRGWIFTGKKGKKKVAIKIKNPASQALHRIEHEADMLQLLNKKKIGPVYVSHSSDYVAYEFVEGEFIIEYMTDATKKQIVSVLLDVLDQCREMDKMGIDKEEMSHPHKHILVIPKGKAVMLDFERAHYTEKVSNVTQFCDYLTNGTVQLILVSKRIVIDSGELINLAKTYKHEPSDKNYQLIRNMI